jgi:predicted ATPase with chaperone activity
MCWISKRRERACRPVNWGKISGPLLDRIDMQIEVPAVSEQELTGRASGEPTDTIRQRVEIAYRRQLERQGKVNARLTVTEIDEHCTTDSSAESLLKQAITRLNFSARAYHRILKVARTIADLGASEGITSAHVAEAVQYRKRTGADSCPTALACDRREDLDASPPELLPNQPKARDKV